jgi:preprotein translocase SecE subunit
VAVKNAETSGSGLLDRLHVGVLAGVVYVLGGLAIVFKLLPWLWFDVLGRSPDSAVSFSLLVIVGLAVAGGLVYLGARLVGPQPTPGVKAGVFTTLVTLLLVVLLTRWASIYVEGWVYGGGMGETVGIAVTAGVGAVLLALWARFLFLAPSFGPRMVTFEEQGWFSTASYKRSQGQRVRRGTILGILVLVGCGIYALESHGSLKGTGDWALNIPFTGKETLKALNDAAPTFGDLKKDDVIDEATFREKNSLLKKDYVKIEEPNDAADLHKNQVITKDEYEKVSKPFRDKKVEGKEPTISGKGPEPATGTLSYQHLTLLPHVRYTLPILLAALALWFAWRIVNVPSFGDFLIATEAELNKVSWTTRRRLIQDTIVVLATVILFTIFLFVVDVAWGKILSWDRIGVLKLPEAGQGIQAPEQKW